MIWFIASIPLMVLAVAIAILPVLHAMRSGNPEKNLDPVRRSRAVPAQHDYDARSPVRSAA